MRRLPSGTTPWRSVLRRWSSSFQGRCPACSFRTLPVRHARTPIARSPRVPGHASRVGCGVRHRACPGRRPDDLILLPAFGPAMVPLLVLLPGVVALSGANVVGSYLRGIGRPGMPSLVSLVALAVNIVANLVLIPRFGIVGAAAASVDFVHAFVTRVVADRRSLHRDARDWVLDPTRQRRRVGRHDARGSRPSHVEQVAWSAGRSPSLRLSTREGRGATRGVSPHPVRSERVSVARGLTRPVRVRIAQPRVRVTPPGAVPEALPRARRGCGSCSWRAADTGTSAIG